MYDLEHYEEIGDEYKKKQKKKLGVFIGFVALSVIFLLVGIFFNYKLGTTYDSLVESGEDKQIYQAIDIDKGNIKGYEKALELYESGFGKNQFSKFVHYYDASTLNKNSKEYFNLTYKLAHMLFFNYTDSKDFRERITRAGKYFEKIIKQDKSKTCDNYKNAETYYSIYKVYDKYEIKYEEPTEEDMKELIESLNVCLDQIQENQTNKYAQAIVLYQINELVYGYRDEFADVDIDKDEVINLLDRINDIAKELKSKATLANAKEKLQSINKNHSTYCDDIEKAYESQAGEGE